MQDAQRWHLRVERGRNAHRESPRDELKEVVIVAIGERCSQGESGQLISACEPLKVGRRSDGAAAVGGQVVLGECSADAINTISVHAARVEARKDACDLIAGGFFGDVRDSPCENTVASFDAFSAARLAGRMRRR